MITEVTPIGPASPPAPLRMERGVITEIPLHVLRMLSNPSPSISRPVGVTSHTTPLSIRRGAGGEASVNSVCRRRSVGSKLCAKMLSELCVLCERKTFTKYVSSPIGVTSHITPLAIRRGAGGEATVSSVRDNVFLLSKPFKKKKRPSPRSTVISE